MLKTTPIGTAYIMNDPATGLCKLGFASQPVQNALKKVVAMYPDTVLAKEWLATREDIKLLFYIMQGKAHTERESGWYELELCDVYYVEHFFSISADGRRQELARLFGEAQASNCTIYQVIEKAFNPPGHIDAPYPEMDYRQQAHAAISELAERIRECGDAATASNLTIVAAAVLARQEHDLMDAMHPICLQLHKEMVDRAEEEKLRRN